MTEKRFYHKLDECGVYHYIYDNKEIIAEAFYSDDAEDITNLLNELYESNEQLKKENEHLKRTGGIFCKCGSRNIRIEYSTDNIGKECIILKCQDCGNWVRWT